MPFTTEEFFDVFEQYNRDVFPMQIVMVVLAILVFGLIAFRSKYTDRAVATILAFFWIWIGVVYHWGYFAEINKAAYMFGGLFVLQGLLFLIFGTLRQQFHWTNEVNLYSRFGGAFIIYALLLYPAFGYLLEHRYPENPTFGLPCPTTIFTFGVLLWTDNRFSKYLLIMPLLWSLLGFTAAFNMGVWEDTLLGVAGVLGTGLMLYRSRKQQPVSVLQQTAKPV